MAKKKSFEDSLERLEEIAELLESNEVSLEESVKLYKEGIELSVSCGKCLTKIEQEVTLLQESAEGIFTEKKFEYNEE